MRDYLKWAAVGLLIFALGVCLKWLAGGALTLVAGVAGVAAVMLVMVGLKESANLLTRAAGGVAGGLVVFLLVKLTMAGIVAVAVWAIIAAGAGLTIFGLAGAKRGTPVDQASGQNTP